jgi:hypothetical protein
MITAEPGLASQVAERVVARLGRALAALIRRLP